MKLFDIQNKVDALETCVYNRLMFINKYYRQNRGKLQKVDIVSVKNSRTKTDQLLSKVKKLSIDFNPDEYYALEKEYKDFEWLDNTILD